MPNRIDVEAILDDLYASEINISISWLWDGGMKVKLGDDLNGYEAEGKVSTMREAAVWAPGSGLPALPGERVRAEILRVCLRRG